MEEQMRRVLIVFCIMAFTLVVGISMCSAAGKPITYYTLTVASTNPTSGVAITVSPLDKNGAGNGTTQFTRSYAKGTVVTLTAPATSTGGSFVKWQKGTTDYATTQATTVTMTAAATMTAVYGTVTTTYTLTVASTNPTSGVAIIVSPVDKTGAGNGTTQFTRTYNSGTSVTLTAPATASSNNFSKWQKNGVDAGTALAISVSMTANTTMTAVYVTPPPSGNHASVTGTYNTPAEVTAKCLTCHSSAGPGVNVSSAVPNSLHGMMPTASPNVINNTGLSQKLMEINTFCTYPNPAQAGAACLTCHPTLGKFQNLAAADIDCLMCHNDNYKRSFTPEPDSAKWIRVTDWSGVARTYVPAAADVNGNYSVQFNFAAMTPGTTGLSLIQGAKRPTTTTCLNCHAKAGGSDWAKRGDIGLNSATATSDQDIHLASVANGGAGLSCSSCHVSSSHKIPGRGIDLRPTESGVAVKKCTDCHLNFDSGSAHAAAGAPRSEGDRHVKRVACQACHITAFGKGGATEVARNWKGTIEWNAGLCMGQGGWAPQETDVSNGIPDFVFFNKTSYVYKFGETLSRIDPVSGLTSMADAVGGVNDTQGVSFLIPIKRHTSNMAVMNSGTNAGKVIPFDVVWQFMTGYADQAAERGKAFAGWTGTHEWKTVEAELALNHGVSPAARVTCTNCHHGRNQFSTAYVTKLDKLGYKLKDANKDGKVDAADEAIICSQCHLQKAFKTDWQLQHNHTAKGSGIGCTFCHDFKRPERGLCEPCNANGTENTACINEFVDTNYYNHCQ
jgi:hypothetical protein